jgi:gamma-glutamyltranspeptidase/glutathione hydrolase
MSPTFVFVRGEPNPVAAIGASGGPRIITTTLQILLNTTVFDQLPDAAVQSPRYHHQWMPDELLLEPTLFRKTSAELSLFGHTTKSQDSLAVGQMACRRKDGLWGVSDFRKGGRPAGW